MRQSQTKTRTVHAIVRPVRARKCATPATHAQLSCASCSVHRACLACGLTAAELERFSDLATAKRKVLRGASLVRTSEPVRALYVMHSGALKTISTYRDGREKVTGFHLPGDIIGLEALDSGTHPYDAVALEDSAVCIVPLEELQRLSQSTPALLQELFRALSADISRDHGLVLLLGGMKAEERIAAFVLSLSRRHQRLGYAPDRFRLRMTRCDIASYLGLSLETVCRTLSRFQRDGLITLREREVRIVDADALTRLVGAWPLPKAPEEA